MDYGKKGGMNNEYRIQDDEVFERFAPTLSRFIGSLLSIGMMLTVMLVVPSANAAELAPGGLQADSASAQQIEQATKDIFTKVIVKDAATGTYKIDANAREQYAPGASAEQLKGLADFLAYNDQTGAVRFREARNWGAYALCVLGGATGFGNIKKAVKNINWTTIGEWIAARNWGALGSLLGKVVSAVAKFTGTKLTVAALIASIAWYAVKCWGV